MNRKHKNKNKDSKSTYSLIQRKSSENRSSVEQNIEECLPEILRKDIVNIQETKVNNESSAEIPKAPKRQRNNKKKGQIEKTDIIILENEIEQTKTESEKTSLPAVNDKNQISTNIVNEDQTKPEQSIQPVLPIARKKKNKNKKCTHTSDLSEEIIDELEVFEKFHKNTTDNAEKKDDLTSATANQNQSHEQENKHKKRKDKKNKKRNDFEPSDNHSEKKLTSSFENKFDYKPLFTNDLATDDIREKVTQKKTIEIENIEVLKYSSGGSGDEMEWKVGSHKKRSKKNKKLLIDVKKESHPKLVSQENDVLIPISESGKSFERKGSPAFINELPAASNNEQKPTLVDVETLKLAKENLDSTEYFSSTSEQFDTKNNSVKQETAQNEETFAEKDALTVPFLIPDTPIVRSKDNLPFTVVLPCTDSIEEKVAVQKDFKSKVIEVNDDLEQLKITIEKSLTDLTVVEKVETNEKSNSNGEKETSMSGLLVHDNRKKGGKIIKIYEPAGLNVNLRESTLQVDGESSIYQTVELVDCIKQEQENSELDNFKTDPLKTDNSENNEKRNRFSVTEENSLHLDKTNEKISEFNQMVKEKNKSSVLQSGHEKMHPEEKGKSRKKDKQKTSNNQNIKISNKHKSLITEVAASSEKSSQETRNSETTKVKTEKYKNCDDIIEESDKKEIIKKNAVTLQGTEKSKYISYNKIEGFEDTLPTNLNDVDKNFEIIASEIIDETQSKEMEASMNNYTTLEEQYLNKSKEKKENTVSEQDHEKENSLVSNPKNLLGPLDTPVSLNKIDYKKEKNKTPTRKQAQIKTKDFLNTGKERKQSGESGTGNKEDHLSNHGTDITSSDVADADEGYVYKYSFRKVFLPLNCHVCKKDLKEFRVPCSFCNLILYCSPKHKDDDWNKHQALCFAVSSVAHTKGLKFIYSDAKDIVGQNYRLLRMQAIVSCEKILQRKLAAWEQEALLYPRMCAEPACREWTQNNLKDCEGCGQIAYCKGKREHLAKSHQRWCKSYHLYRKLVIYQQTVGKLEPKLPSRIITNMDFQLPDKINELLVTLYEEKIDIDDMHYAALTQITTVPLTTVYCYQLYDNNMNSSMANGANKKSSFTVHLIEAELQFEADVLNKWEIFFLHLRPDIKDLDVVLVGFNLNPSNLPLELLSKIKLCQYCRENKRRVRFSFYDKKHYCEFYDSDDFNIPDIICAFNPSIHRAFMCSSSDSWTSTLKSIFKTRAPFCLTSHTPKEIERDLAIIKKCARSEFRIITGPSPNPYSSVRPDRNFISDDEMPLIYKNYYYMVLSGAV